MGTRHRIRTLRRSAPRRGSVVLELIVMLPVWLIVMGAIVQFGLLIGNRQQLALAARVGAEEASRTVDLELTNTGDPVPANVVQVVQQQLDSSGIDECKITLEHNLGGDKVLSSPVAAACDCPTLNASFPTYRGYVRVTVYVPSTELAPNVLSFFGFDISDQYLRNATTFRYEL